MLSPSSLLALLVVALVLRVSGEGGLFNETLRDNETAHKLPHNYSSNITLQINETLLLDDTSEANMTREDSVTTKIFHDDVSMPPQVSINMTLLSETAHKLPHNYSSNITLQINETLLLDDTSEANMTREDSESFQDQEKYVHWHCHETATLEALSHKFCGAPFEYQMATISKEKWCDWEEIVQPYNQLSECMEELAGILHCYYPNQQSQAFFVAMHEIYFHTCQEEDAPLDAPPGLVLALTLLPVSLIPILVFMVVWKNNVRE